MGLLVKTGAIMDGSDDPVAASAPIVLTVAPTPTPKPEGMLALPFGGGYDIAVRTPTPTPTPTPEPAPVTVPGVHYFAASVVEYEFLDGWNDGGGAALKSPASVSRWVTCESGPGWNVVTAGSFLGLLQFHPSTFGTIATITGLWDAYDPYHQGFNGATWALMVEPGSTAGWPRCWWR